MKLPLRYYGHPDLRAKAKPIEKVDAEILQLAQDMIETMIEHNGVGLAGPQVGKLLRIFIRRDERELPDGTFELGPPQVLINPTLSQPSQETAVMVEGCLSIPRVQVEVRRPRKIHARYQNLQGEWVEEELENFLARVTMHENDHLNGVLHIDRTDPQERKRVEPLLRDIKKKYGA